MSGTALGGGGVVDKTLLDLAILSGEQDKLGLVSVQSLDVELLTLSGGVSSAVVNGDADGAGKGGAETGSLELTKSEATAVPDLAGVLACARGHNRAQLLNGSGVHSFSLGLSLLKSDSLLAWLVEVDSDSELPVLAEMYVGDDVIVLDHC